MTQKSCAVGMRNAILRNHLKCQLRLTQIPGFTIWRNFFLQRTSLENVLPVAEKQFTFCETVNWTKALLTYKITTNNGLTMSFLLYTPTCINLMFLLSASWPLKIDMSYAWLRHLLKIHHQASFVRNFLSNLWHFRVIFTWEFFSSWLLRESRYNKIYNWQTKK